MTGQSILGARRVAEGLADGKDVSLTPRANLRNDVVMDSVVVLPLVVYGTTAVYVVSGVLSMFTAPNGYDQVGQGNLVGGDEDCASREAMRARSTRLAAERAEREDDARQMLQARSERLVRRGLAPLDIEAELARLDGLEDSRPAAPDPEVLEEIRQLVLARNERRARQGLEVLDVDAEIASTLAELAISPRATPPHAGAPAVAERV